VNLGLIAFAGSADVLVTPTPDHARTIAGLDKLQTADSTATGQAIFAALQSIQTVNAVLKGPSDKPPPARIVLLSDGKENKPNDPNNSQGAYTAAARSEGTGVPISTIAFGTPVGYVDMKDETVPVPVDDEMMKANREPVGRPDSHGREHRCSRHGPEFGSRPAGLSGRTRPRQLRMAAGLLPSLRARRTGRTARQPAPAGVRISPAVAC
jgi:hypothetical protein